VTYAEQLHAGQRRADGRPCILHPLEVASLLYYAGAPDHLIAAGVMHDLVEKSEAIGADLRAEFGPRIAGLVLAVSDDDRLGGYARRKAALRQQVCGAGEEALMLFAADKLSKVRELRCETSVDLSAGAGTTRVREVRARRLKHYQRSLALLEERLPESPLVHDLRDEGCSPRSCANVRWSPGHSEQRGGCAAAFSRAASAPCWRMDRDGLGRGGSLPSRPEPGLQRLPPTCVRGHHTLCVIERAQTPVMTDSNVRGRQPRVRCDR
jgi:hypothetical protein